jgi:hypothetical protein
MRNYIRHEVSYSIQSRDDLLSLDEIARSTMTLIDERIADWLVSPEGREREKRDAATDLFIGANNPDFTPEAARQVVEWEYNPFASAIAVLERNGYEVTKK